MSKRYEIASLGDFFAVPAERRAEMFKDFEMTMSLIELANDDPSDWLRAFEWTDDGIKEFGLVDDTTGEPFLILKTDKA